MTLRRNYVYFPKSHVKFKLDCWLSRVLYLKKDSGSQEEMWFVERKMSLPTAPPSNFVERLFAHWERSPGPPQSMGVYEMYALKRSRSDRDNFQIREIVFRHHFWLVVTKFLHPHQPSKMTQSALLSWIHAQSGKIERHSRAFWFSQ